MTDDTTTAGNKRGAWANATRRSFDEPGDCPGCNAPLTEITCWPGRTRPGWRYYYCPTKGCRFHIGGKDG